MSTYFDLGYDKRLYRSPLELSGYFESSDIGTHPLGSDASPTTNSPISQGLPATLHLSGDTDQILFSGKTTFSDTTAGFRMGVDTDGVYKWIIGNGSSSADWSVTTSGVFTVNGSITATSGSIGGFTIGSDFVRDAANSMGLASTVTGGDDVRFWAGDTFANRASAPFRVTEAGVVTATSGTIGGWSLSSTRISAGTGATTVGLDATVTGGDDVRIFAGDATPSSAPFRVTEAGVLTATSGTVGGWTLSSTTLTGGNATLNSTGVLTLGTGNDVVIASAVDATYRLWVGNSTAASAAFRVTTAGAVTATSGTVGGWTLGATTLTGGNATLDSAGDLTLGTGNNIVRLSATDATYRIWVGNATAASAPFRVDLDGDVTIGDGGVFSTFSWDGTDIKVNSTTLEGQFIYGDGDDGTVTENGGGTVTLTADMFYDNLTVTNNTTINTGGFRIFVKGTLTIDSGSSIQRNGNAGGNGSAGTIGGNPGAGGTAGAALAAGSLIGSLAGEPGGAGGDGDDGANPHTAGTAGDAGVNASHSMGVNGVAGAAGGAVPAIESGGAGGAAGTTTGTILNQIHNVMSAYYQSDFDGATITNFTSSASSGGSGGGGGGRGGSGAQAGGAGGGGAGSGSVGGVVTIFAHRLVNNGTIQAHGGAGGNGGNGGTPNGTGPDNQDGGGGGGAGSGGSGGVIVLVYHEKTGSGTITVTGGAAGSVGTGGSAGFGSGVPGNNGSAGNAGNTGELIELQF